jgi:flavin-binding protein dodecin
VSEHVYRVTEVVGTSQESVAQAIKNGVARAGQTVRHVEWFEVLETRGAVAPDGTITFQVGLKVGFRLDD